MSLTVRFPVMGVKWIVIPNTFLDGNAVAVAALFKFVFGVESFCYCSSALMSVVNEPSGMVNKDCSPSQLQARALFTKGVRWASTS